MDYATLFQVREYLGFKAGENTADDARLQGFIRGAHDWINSYCQRRFDVRRAALKFDYPIKQRSNFGVYPGGQGGGADWFAGQMNATADLSLGRLRLTEDLLAIETLTNGDGTVIADTDYVLEAANAYPQYAVRLNEGNGLAWQKATNGNRWQVITIDGWWGF